MHRFIVSLKQDITDGESKMSQAGLCDIIVTSRPFMVQRFWSKRTLNETIYQRFFNNDMAQTFCLVTIQCAKQYSVTILATVDLTNTEFNRLFLKPY